MNVRSKRTTSAARVLKKDSAEGIVSFRVRAACAFLRRELRDASSFVRFDNRHEFVCCRVIRFYREAEGACLPGVIQQAYHLVLPYPLS
jgi:hypothetical protein